MKISLICLVSILVSLSYVIDADDEGKSKAWQNFKIKNQRAFGSKRLEQKRMANFFRSKAAVDKHNEMFEKGLVSYKQEYNIFSDMDEGEKRQYLGAKNHDPIPIDRTKRGISTRGYVFNATTPVFYMYFADPGVVLPTSIDYRNTGWSEIVREQGPCGACWAFSASTVMSYYQYKKTNVSYLFSVQNLLDCSDIWGSDGCNGGSPAYAFEYMQINKQTLESNYPYKATKNNCTRPSKGLFGATGFLQITQDQASLEQAVAKLGPVVVSIHSEQLYNYASGIWDGSSGANRCNPNFIDHSVVVVGYGVDSATSTKYWIIKNSWGTGWGENGYFRMVRNSTNLCGIYTYSYTLN